MTRKIILQCLDYVRKTLMTDQQDEVTAGKRIYVSGGGAYKYCDLIESKLKLTVAKVRIENYKSIHIEII